MKKHPRESPAGSVPKDERESNKNNGMVPLASALTTDQRELRTSLFFLASINGIAAGSALFSSSAEEELHEKAKSFSSAKMRHYWDFTIGQVAAIHFHF